MRLGQHFLIHKPTLKKIADAIDVKDGDVIIEIGPGHGELTEEFRIRNKELSIIAIEKDEILADALKKKFRTENHMGNHMEKTRGADVEIIKGDALRIISELTARSSLVAYRYKIIGNIPYYITGYLLRILGELQKKPSLIVFLVQKEVAQRICAKPPRMNLLAASVQIWAEPKIIARVSKGCFRPPPKVDSAAISLRVKTDGLPSRHFLVADCFPFLRILFKQPRKTILNNLASGKGMEDKKEKLAQILTSAGVNPLSRPQNLSLEEIIKLSQALKELFNA